MTQTAIIIASAKAELPKAINDNIVSGIPVALQDPRSTNAA
jgi:hypothetical protein